MAHITFLLGPTVDARSRLLEEELRLKHADPMNCLYIVPSRAMAMELEAHGPGSMNRRIDTLLSLIERIFFDDLFYQSFRESSLMDEAMRELAVRLILERRNAGPEGLRYFYPLFSSSTRTETLAGVYRHILGFFSLLVNNNFEDEYVEVLSRVISRFDEQTPGAGENRYALDTDLALLFGDYEEFKRSNHLYDKDDTISSVRSFLAEGNVPGILKDIYVLVLNGFTSITKAEETILLHLLDHADEVIWLLDCDPFLDGPITTLIGETVGRGDTGRYEAFRIFSSIGSMLKKIEEARYPTALKRAAPEAFKNPFAAGFYLSGKYDNRGERAIHIKSFNTRFDEVRGIAGEIKRILKERKKEGVHGIRVIFPDLARYSSLVYEVFSAYGIPFNITKGLPLSSSPLAGLFLLMLDMPLNNFRRQDIRAFFTSGLVSPAAITMGNQDKAQWLALLEKHGAFFGGETKGDSGIFPGTPPGNNGCKAAHRWIETVDLVAGQCGIQGGAIVPGWLSQARDYFFSRFRSMSKEKNARLLTEYHNFLYHLFFAHENIKPFEDLLRINDPGAFLQALLRLLALFGIQKNILLLLKDGTGLTREETEKCIQRDIKSLNTLKDLAVKTARELERAEYFMPSAGNSSLLERFRNNFAALVSQSRIRETFRRGAVDISECADIIGFSPDYIFAGGLCSEEFPLKQPDDFIIPESSAPHLRRIDLTDQSRYLFSHLLRNYGRDLYLSYPKRITDKEAQPSPVLLDMISIMENEGPLPSHGTEALEYSLPWEQNPYFTSSEELLNAIEVERKLAVYSKPGSFTHDHIILGTDRLLNESIIRGVGCLLARNCMDGLTEYDGLVSGSDAFHRYRSHLRAPFSPSRLDMIANCPMQYLFQGIYRLEPIEELEQELSPKDLGSHVHAVLKLILEEVKKRRHNIASIGLPRAFALAREISTRYFSQLAYLEGLDLFEAQKRDILDGLETDSIPADEDLQKRQGLIAQLLRFEARNLNNEEVINLEYGFGDEGSNPVRMGKIQLRGSIDRVDRLDEREEVYLIYDYKTGRAPGPGEVKKGLSFQLPAYIAALTAERDAKAVAARYYLINRKQLAENNSLSSPIGYNFPQKAGIDLTGVTLTGEYVNTLMDLLDQGVFHHSVDEAVCSFCDFRYACYKNMRRMAYLVDSGASPALYSGRKNLERWKEVEGFQKRWKEVQAKMAEPWKAKKDKKRSKDLEQVLKFKQWLEEKLHSLPLDQNYIDEILASIEEYQH